MAIIVPRAVISGAIAGLRAAARVLLRTIRALSRAVKHLLIRRWSAEIAAEVRRRAQPAVTDGVSHNRAGLGGHGLRPLHISWQELFEQCQDPNIIRCADRPRVVEEYLFFAYVGPLEAWCERNCTGPWYLWSDEGGVHLLLDDTADRMLWSIAWDGHMPDLDELGRLRL